MINHKNLCLGTDTTAVLLTAFEKKFFEPNQKTRAENHFVNSEICY